MATLLMKMRPNIQNVRKNDRVGDPVNNSPSTRSAIIVIAANRDEDANSQRDDGTYLLL